VHQHFRRPAAQDSELRAAQKGSIVMKRKPDFVIGPPDDPYLLRWWIIPHNRFFNIYLHKILRDDDDRALHDHPWCNVSLILRGGYKEHQPGGKYKLRRAGRPVFRKATAAHRLELHRDRWHWVGIGKSRKLVLQRIVPCWSLFITGPKVREWGFLCPRGWKHHLDFVNPKNPGEVGNGCGD